METVGTRYTVKQLAQMAGITPRTLHHYDEIGLLPPTAVGDNGYRYYDETAALRLQQILFYRELDLPLGEIRALLDAPEFDVRAALLAHKRALRGRMRRMNALLETIDRTIAQLEGEEQMDVDELFGGFESEQERAWAEEAVEQYGYDNKLVQESARRWRGMTAADKTRLKEEGDAAYRAFVGLIGEDPAAAEVQAAVADWHAHVATFYDPGPDVLAGLGRMYVDDSRFRATFTAMHPELPEFLRDAILIYVDDLG